jgi:AcrR family transcriptional regulator
MGPPGSETWNAMLRGAEYILREEGHAQLTSRRIAEHIGVKQRLVYYYFRTMDDLIVETFRLLSKRELERLGQANKSPRALREIWDTSIGSTDARLIAEFMALANRIPGLKSEVIQFIEESRSIEIEAIVTAMAKKSYKSHIPAPALALIATSVALSISREAQLGSSVGHQDFIAIIESFISSLEN